MNRIFAYALATLVLLGSTALLGNSGHEMRVSENAEARLATDGAYRDGIFVGRLVAKRGQVQRPLIGRWSSNRDRASFSAGYRRGYEEFVAGLSN